MPWRVEIPYDRNSPYMCSDSQEAASIICGSSEYQDNYEMDSYAFDDYLDTCYGKIDICGYECDASEALKGVNSELYDEMKREQEAYEAGENVDNVEEQLDDNEDERGGVWFEGNIRAFYIEEEEEDDEGHDEDEVFDCFEL